MNPNTDFETVTARGDHGGITFRKSDGTVVPREFDSGYENDPNAGYPAILWANPETLTQDPTDILRVGYYYKDKNGLISYEPPIEPEELTADPLPTPEKPMKRATTRWSSPPAPPPYVPTCPVWTPRKYSSCGRFPTWTP